MPDDFEAVMRELFASEGRYALQKALRRQPLPFVRLMGRAPAAGGQGPARNQPLTEEEAEDRVVAIMRALGEERLTRLLARVRQG
jgi:hypothetical protein